MRPFVQAGGLVKRFGDFTAVDGIDLLVHPGECFGLLGPNGAGKTSTIRMITCVSPPTAGSLAIEGLDAGQHGRAIRARIGVVPQNDNLDPDLNVEENLARLRALLSACPRPSSASGAPRTWRSCSSKTGRARASMSFRAA